MLSLICYIIKLLSQKIKKTQKTFLEKASKQDFDRKKLYEVISLLDYIKKVIEKM